MDLFDFTNEWGYPLPDIPHSTTNKNILFQSIFNAHDHILVMSLIIFIR